MGEELATAFSDLGLSLLGVAALIGFALLLSCFVKIVTVLSMIRVGLGVGTVPGAFATGGLAVVLTLFVMSPQLDRSAQIVHESLKGKTAATDRDRAAALDNALGTWREFLAKHTEQSELKRFGDLARKLDSQAAQRRPDGAVDEGGADASWRVIAPAFLVSELRKGFSTGLRVFLPFLVIELLTAVTLVALGIERLDPSLVSFPLKILVFALVDGWALITQGLIATYS